MKGRNLLKFSLFFVLIFCLSLCGCGTKGNGNNTVTSSDTGSVMVDADLSDITDSSAEDTSSIVSSIDDESSSSVKVSSDNPTSSKTQSTQKGDEDEEKICYLTFDDGPSKLTPEFLKVLDKYHVKATYFVMSTPNLEYVKNIHRAGHTVALHTDTHQWSIYKSELDYFNDLYSISDKVFEITGERSKVIRFPGGSSNSKSKNYCEGIMTALTKKVEKQGFRYFDWNVDSGDAAGNNVAVSKILNNIKTQSEGKAKVCVLMHDTNSKQTTLDALPQIIEYYQSEGYKFEALTTSSDVFHHTVNN